MNQHLLNTQLTDLFKSALTKLKVPDDLATVTLSQRPDLSDYQCNSALPSAKVLKIQPREIAQKIIDTLPENDLIEKMTIDGPGFINIILKNNFLLQEAGRIDSFDDNLKTIIPDKPRTVIDFAGPNLAKPMHVGHLRSAIIGDCLQRLYKSAGIDTVSVNHLGDWGTQMGMLLLGVQRKYPDLPHFNSPKKDKSLPELTITIAELEEIYPTISSESKSDKAVLQQVQAFTKELQDGHFGLTTLWQHFVKVSREELTKDFGDLGITFDKWMGESYYDTYINGFIEELVNAGLAKESDGALVIPLEELSDKNVPPLLLKKTDGASLYSTTDLTAIKVRVQELKAKKILYVVDKRQSLHFKQVFTAIKKVKPIADSLILEHIAFGTVNGKDGKPFKTREGGVMRLQDLISTVITKAKERMVENKIAETLPEEEKEAIAKKVGLAALKFADLINHRETDYVFDLDSFTKFEGKTGPYILYTAVRIKSILKKADEAGTAEGTLNSFSDIERKLILKTIQVYDVIQQMIAASQPHMLCEYIFSYAQLFNQFYASCNIVRETDKEKQASWLTLIGLNLKVFEKVLYIIGITIPDRM